MAPKKDETEDKLRKLIADTVGEILDGRDKRQRSERESPEQRWLREVIGEEIGRHFEAFAKALEGEPGGKGGGRGEEEPEGEGFLARLVKGGQ